MSHQTATGNSARFLVPVRVLRMEVDRADQRQMGEQVGLGDADLGALGGEQPLAPPHVGPPDAELGALRSEFEHFAAPFEKHPP